MKVLEIPLTRPLLRGYSHQAAFYFALGACSILLLSVHSKKILIAMTIYSASLIGLFGISALYHRITWNPRQRILMKKIDHAAIYILIAGTSTPIAMLALTSVHGIKLLVLVWSAALVVSIFTRLTSQNTLSQLRLRF